MIRGCLALLFASCCLAQTPALQLTRVLTGLNSPTDIQHAGDGSGRLFIVEQDGLIRIARNNTLLPTPFLDLRAKTNGTGECGLLGLAFPPGYAQKKYFYVNYTHPNCTSTVVSRIHTSVNPDLADAATEVPLLTQSQPFTNHNAGQLRFGPDGYLYVAFGDGGSANDPQGNGQAPGTWLGKLLRIDVENGSSQYSIPPTNPFANSASARPEIWASGLRNPWRYSFDRETGDLWIADVGQNRAEEIDFQPASSTGGENYGWNRMEGLQCRVNGCNTNGLVLPIFEYSSRNLNDRSITGGFVYRGSTSPGMRGLYFYADYVSGRLWALRKTGSAVSNNLVLDTPYAISTFGEDEAGEIYFADHSGGAIYRIDGSSIPVVSSSGVVNAASFEPGIVAGSLATIFGSGLTTNTGVQQATGIPLPLNIGGTAVSAAGRQTPILAVANANGIEQINIQVPWETAGSTAVVVVSRDGVQSSPASVTLLTAHPAVFAANDRAIVVHNQDGTLVTDQKPLQGGEFIYFYATGLGEVENNPGTNQPGPRNPLARTLAPIIITLGNQNCEVQFAGLAPDLVGVYQINIKVPAGLSTGTNELLVRLGTATSKPVLVPVQ